MEYLRIFYVYVPLVETEQIQDFFESFIERFESRRREKPIRSWDLGPLILSHVYLLLACAIPLWSTQMTSCNNNNNMVQERRRDVLCALIATCGVITIGISDSAASLVGQRFGRTRWMPRSMVNKKTVEGTLGGWVSILLTWSMLLVIMTTTTITTGFQSSDDGGSPGSSLWPGVSGSLWSSVSGLVWPDGVSLWRLALISGGSVLLEGFSSQNDNLLVPIWTATSLILSKLL